MLATAGLLTVVHARQRESAALAAVAKWRYKPAMQGSKPVDVYFTVRVDFELQ